MPSSKNYKRDYKQEDANDSRQRKDARAQRNRARTEMVNAGKAHVGDGKDVGHLKAIGRGGKNNLANLAMQTPAENRSFRRASTGKMVSETSKKEAARRRKK